MELHIDNVSDDITYLCAIDPDKPGRGLIRSARLQTSYGAVSKGGPIHTMKTWRVTIYGSDGTHLSETLVLTEEAAAKRVYEALFDSLGQS